MGFGYPKVKTHKYSAQSTIDLDGVTCPSKLHAETANMLIKERRRGKISGFDREVPIQLSEKCKECGASALVYKVDFVTQNPTRYVEAKGAKTTSFKKREKKWRTVGPGPLEVWMGRYRNGVCVPYLAETIIPK